MNSKEDVRVKKTRLALNQAFEELISTRHIEDISVNEICNQANVRRATFYKHYSDKYDFFSHYVGSLRIKYDSKPDTLSHINSTVEYYVNYAKRIVEYIDENSAMVSNLLGSTQLHIIIGIIVQKNLSDTIEKLKTNVDRGMKLPTSIESCAAMLAGGIGTVIINWLMTNKARSVEDLSNDVAIFVRNILST